MGELNGKNVLLGVTGGIAAYRSAELARRLRQAGAQVRVVMTDGATQFITELTMQAVSGNPVRRELFDDQAEAGMGHIELARWAQMVLIAPASANFLARLAHGISDDLLSTLCLVTEAPIAVAPAMNRVMWENQATQDNVSLLKSRGLKIFGPGCGPQACGETGPGRMLDPDEIVALLRASSTGPLASINVLVTAGATWEAIDPVRGITNRSSGKMGYAIADAAQRSGANVTLISGPVTDSDGIIPATGKLVRTDSAQNMLRAVLDHLPGQDVFISVAAVSDYRPSTARAEKIKKNQDQMALELVRNPDILATVKEKAPDIFAVGFAAETSDMIAEGRRKLLAKRADLIAANSVSGEQSAIGADTNTLHLIDRNGVTTVGPASKRDVAQQLVDQICERLHAQNRLQAAR